MTGAFTVRLPQNVAKAYQRWARGAKFHPHGTLDYMASWSVRQLTPAGPADPRWKRSMNVRFCDHPSDNAIIGTIERWKGIHPCVEVRIVLPPETFAAVLAIAEHRQISPETFCARCIGFQASGGGLEFETAFHRFERALAAEWRETKKQAAVRTAAAIETGLGT